MLDAAPPTRELESTREAPAARLAIRGLSHRFGDRVVLDDLSFSVPRGEVHGLLGPNGSGKSTTFRVLIGEIFPASGTLELDGERIAPGDRRLRARTGVVFQSSSLDPRLTARENLSLAAALYRVPKPEARDRIAELLELTELSGRADEIVSKLSGGMRRRLELVRALLHRPDILLLDEPTTGLDEGAFQRTWDRILDLREREGLTVLLTTHRPEEAERCDRITAIANGKKAMAGAPAQLKAHVSGDIVEVRGTDAYDLAREIAERFEVDVRVVDGAVLIEHPEGHALIPRLVEALPAGRIAAISMRRPTLADVFLALTGDALSKDRS